MGAAAGIAAGATLGSALYGISSLDKKTDGKVSTILSAGMKNVRSNYAFVSDVAKNEAGLGLLAGLTLIAGGVLGGAGGFLVGGPAGAVAGAGLGIAAAGKVDRMVAETGIAGESVKQSALYSESKFGQERYNFGRDVTHLAGKIVGIIPGAQADNVSAIVQDTNMGIGALVSGLINFGFEVSLAPDIKGAQLGGKAVRSSLLGDITETSGMLSKKIANTPMGQARVATRLEADVNLIKKTAAGEITRYKPVFKFYRENDVATIVERTGMRGEAAQIGAKLIAGKSDEVIGLVFRIGRGDITAIDELAVKHAATHAAILRYEGILDKVEAGNLSATASLPQHILVGKTIKSAKKVLEAEINTLRLEYSWLNNSLKLDSALQEKSISKFK
jgi:ribosomal protein S28E/S33